MDGKMFSCSASKNRGVIRRTAKLKAALTTCKLKALVYEA
jgi:hypothetical protein